MSSKKAIKVKAKFAYQRQNEDELTFPKGAIIMVSKNDDGGWWEGTLNGNTGWFPSNYVKEVRQKIESESVSPQTVQKQSVLQEVETKTQETKLAYYQQVLQNLLEIERTYVKELQSLVGSYIKPLQPQTTPGGEGIPESDICVLSGNIQAIIDFQLKFVKELEECSKISYQQQQVGVCFEKNGDTFKQLYDEYCGNHPSAVVVLQTHKEQISKQIENKSGQNSGITQLTTGLSKPFRHLEEYSSLLRELERHLDDTHPDRSHVLQAISQYERISLVCQETRKRKETIQHILSSPIQGWEGETLSSLGPVLYMSSVIFLSGLDDRKERYLLLFPNALLMLSVSPRMSGFIYEGKLPLTALKSKRLDDTQTYQHAFEITGNLIDRKIVITRSTEEQRRWLQVLEAQCDQCHRTSLAPVAANAAYSIVKHIPVTQIPPVPELVPGQSHGHTPIRITPEIHASPTVSPPPFPVSKSGAKANQTLSLRPGPPVRHIPNSKDASGNMDRSKSPKGTRKKKKPNKPDSRKTTDEDALANLKTTPTDTARLPDEQEVLEVLKHYCNAMHTRNTTYMAQGKTRHTSILEEKIIVEDPENEGLIEEKSLVDTVYELKDQVASLIQEQKKFGKRLEEESKSRRKLENLIRRAAKTTGDSTSSVRRTSSVKTEQERYLNSNS
uniref:rho guanine nucleotide exchange factor 7-like isoform X1 n=1 Tax=Styela clava TaxID=7725 RepID=UPI001939A453|nr:rho guanine nucleotide exchange factor 7-like isoform X1 [Styela clava]